MRLRLSKGVLRKQSDRNMTSIVYSYLTSEAIVLFVSKMYLFQLYTLIQTSHSYTAVVILKNQESKKSGPHFRAF